MTKNFIDILIVVPLEEEAEVVFQHFTPGKSEPHDDIMFTDVVTNCDGISAVVVQCTEAGINHARRACEVAFRRFEVGLVVCVGIAGRISTDLKLGDVCFSKLILDVSDGQKAVDVPNTEAFKVLFNPETYKTPTALSADVTFCRTDQSLRKHLFEEWQAQCGARLEKAITTASLNEDFRKQFREFPTAEAGKIVCGPVIASKNFLALLRESQRRLVAIETESGGVFEACQAHHDIPALTFRGISDFADDEKNKLEESTKGLAREVAAQNAVTFFKLQFSNPYFIEYVQARRHALTGEATADLFKDQKTDRSIEDTLSTVLAKAEAELRELSPEFRVQPKGYVLPAPRLTPLNERADPRIDDQISYVEIDEALQDNRVVVVDMPLSYPDAGLPWVLANELSGSILHEKQPIPFVIDGRQISAPTDLGNLVPEVDLKELCENQGVQVVFVVHAFDIRSRSRCSHLLVELEKYPLLKLVLVTRGEGTLLFGVDTVQRLGARIYRVNGVPFLAIANFIRSNFQFEPLQAEVIAYRIHNAFERFNLLPHPSYFAVIPQETLVALLQANRRSELIQLAVDGFLTFLVAEDREVPISRSTRRRFLSELAVEQEVFKRHFSYLELIEFTEAFFARYDFRENAKSFVKRFLDKGLLREQDGRVEFSLPFVKKYLLAVALTKDDKLAKTHFSFSGDDFDFETFDLYAELGASDAIVDDLLARLAGGLKALSAGGDQPGVMLTGELKPALMNKLAELERLRNGVQKSIQSLAAHGQDGERKQRFLDVANRVARNANEAKPDQTKQAKQTAFSIIRRDWRAGCILLGAAAEQLLATKKAELISLLVELASRLIDKQTRANAAVDYQKMKSEVLGSSGTADLLASVTGEGEREQLESALDVFLDLLELAFLAQPFTSTLSFLCEQARHKILAPSIEKAVVSDGQPKIIRAAWLADVDAHLGKTDLRTTISSLPAVPFFRVVLATHLWARVYWAQWRIEDRQDLLEAAEEVIKTTGLTFGEKRVTEKRNIEREKVKQAHKRLKKEKGGRRKR